ncbi:TPA: hypothetical protein OPR08_001955 [Citrobacter koseri]|uniref:hypothetical protein n=1 Tax=Citrobacter koseri TaxID=545 RepID=UPI000D7C8ACA|nr:hypothetical protein [Citrobacter koseri]PYZ79202.1 hypothetical protein DNK65_13550 [Citrobacter koseri]HCR9749752.1 hypothetical protein [Citrobacter koseri]HCR9768938.1 hypothetical protein [Citrobacter koseri]HEM7948726.1 hypothetical protein [Citrobacter koseri]
MKNITYKLLNVFQMVLLIVFYIFMYKYTSGFLKENAMKCPAPMFYETYTKAIEYWSNGFLLTFSPFLLLWISKGGLNWKGFITIHAKFPLIWLLFYMLSAIIYWIAYDISSYHF